MTTLVALPTKDVVVLGCDSLGTAATPMIHLSDLFGFFDKSGDLQVDSAGSPKLKGLSQILDITSSIPFSHMTDVDKIIDFSPLKIGVMLTGILSIGDRTVTSLLSDFKANDAAFKSKPKNYTVKSISTRLLASLRTHYQSKYSTLPATVRPELQLIVAGYDKSGPHPKIAKLDLKKDTVEMQASGSPVFGGQSREIQRIVYGLDYESWVNLEVRLHEILSKVANETAKANGGTVIPPLTQHKLLDKDFHLPGIDANWGDFSEQNAIDCVGFFVGIMEGAQRFSARMPTVGGAIQVALIDRQNGFRFISRREYSHEDHRVQRE